MTRETKRNYVAMQGIAHKLLLIVLLLSGGLTLAACDDSPTNTTNTTLPTPSTRAQVPPTQPQPATREPIIVPSATPCPPPPAPPTLTPAPTPSDYAPQTPQSGLPRATITIRTACGPVTMQVQIATSPQRQEIGLMWRTDLPADEGMLFDFGRDDASDSFWMKNTVLPLSIAFVDKDMNILVLDEMRAFDDQTYHVSAAPYRYAIEANAGFFSRHDVQVGDRIEIELK